MFVSISCPSPPSPPSYPATAPVLVQGDPGRAVPACGSARVLRDVLWGQDPRLELRRSQQVLRQEMEGGGHV